MQLLSSWNYIHQSMAREGESCPRVASPETPDQAHHTGDPAKAAAVKG